MTDLRLREIIRELQRELERVEPRHRIHGTDGWSQARAAPQESAYRGKASAGSG